MQFSCGKPFKEVKSQDLSEIQKNQENNLRPKKIIAAKMQRQCSTYHWTERENQKYLNFLVKSGHLLKLQHKERIRLKVNMRMSRQIRSKNPAQCHTHHQKMMEKFGCIEEIIQNLSQIFNNGAIDKQEQLTQIKSSYFDRSQSDIFARQLEIDSVAEKPQSSIVFINMPPHLYGVQDQFSVWSPHLSLINCEQNTFDYLNEPQW